MFQMANFVLVPKEEVNRGIVSKDIVKDLKKVESQFFGKFSFKFL